MHIGEWLTLVGIIVALLIAVIPAIWKKVRLNPDRELRRKYIEAAKAVSGGDKNLLQPPNVETSLDWSAAQVFLPPYVSRNFIDRDVERRRLLDWTEEDQEDGAKIIWIAELTDRGKSYFAQKVCEEIKKCLTWKALFIDITARREQVVTLDFLLAAFAFILKELSRSTDKSLSNQTTHNEFSPVYAALTDTSTPLWIRACALVTILEQHQYHWFITLDEYDCADSSLEDFIIAVANHAKHTKLLLIGQDRPRVLRRPEVQGASNLSEVW